jgi:hypothetical protein
MKRTEPEAKSYSEILARRTYLSLEEINMHTFFLAIFVGGALFLLPASMGALFFGSLDLFIKILQVSMVIGLMGAAVIIVLMVSRYNNWSSLKKQTRKLLKAEKKMKKAQKFEERWDEL